MKRRRRHLRLRQPHTGIFPDDARAGGAAGGGHRPQRLSQPRSTCWPSPASSGALDARASDINDAMKIAAAHALAELVETTSADYIIPAAFDPRVRDAASAVESRPPAPGVASSSPPLLFTSNT